MSIVAYDMSVKGKRVTYKSIPIVSICDLLNNNKIGNEGNVFRPRQKVIQCDDCVPSSLAAFFLVSLEDQRTHRFPATVRERVDWRCCVLYNFMTIGRHDGNHHVQPRPGVR